VRAQQTVAAETVGSEGVFSVSYTVGTGIDGAILKVRRCRMLSPGQAARFQERGTGLSMVVPNGGRVQVMFRLPDDGLAFPSREAAHRHALERGYTREYFTSPDLRARRIESAREFPHPRAR
jgi:hypothetical protein